jgi:antagonist of KipI
MTADPATLTVLTPGFCSLVVDQGRPGTRSLGVPVGGAADRAALLLGNALVGNPPEAAALEICLSGPTLLCQGTVAAVVFGAPFDLDSDRQHLAAGKTFALQPGERLHIAGTPQNLRAYLCVRGGFDVPVILGSRSALRPLQGGDILPCPAGRLPSRFARFPPHGLTWTIDQPADEALLHVLPGAQADWFPPDALFAGANGGPPVFVVTPDGNRMGLRLRGPALPVPPREIVSEPVCPGTVQVTREGQCIVLGVDGQTIGGYPKIAHVISADLDRLGQLRPGQGVRFAPVALEEAEELAARRRTEGQAWARRLRAADAWTDVP